MCNKLGEYMKKLMLTFSILCISTVLYAVAFNTSVGASYDFDFATIRLEHMCMHPVVSQSSWSGLQGGYTKFEVQL